MLSGDLLEVDRRKRDASALLRQLCVNTHRRGENFAAVRNCNSLAIKELLRAAKKLGN